MSKIKLPITIGGIELNRALQITCDFLDWWQTFLKETEPYAIIYLQAISTVRIGLSESLDDEFLKLYEKK